VVQALAAAEEFVNDLLSTFWLRQTLPDTRQPVEGPRHLKVYGSFAGLLLLLRQKAAGSSSSSSSSSSSRGSGSGGVTDPSLFRREVASYFAAYGGSRQQDAHEFLGDLLNSLQEELCLYGRRFAAQKIQAEREAAAARAMENCLMEEGGGKEDEKEGKGLKKKQITVGKGGKGGLTEVGGGKGGQTSLRTFFRSRSLSLAPSSLTSSSHPEGEKEAGKEGPALAESAGEDTVISQEEAAILEQILPVTRHFHAEVEKTLTCVGVDCAYSRSYIEPFTDFSVDLVAPGEEGEGTSPSNDGGGIPLQLFDLLAHSFQVQELELACERCQRQNKVRVTYCFRKLPHLLVVHLKRFRITGGLGLLGASSSKLQTRVMAPAALDLAQFCDARTANPRDVSTGLEGPAGPQLSKPLLESLAAACPPPAFATRFGTYFKSTSAAAGGKGGKEEEGEGKASAGTSSTPLSKILQEEGGSAAQRLKLQQQRKQAAARDKKEQDENRWPTDEKSKRTTSSLSADDSIVAFSLSDPMLVDLVDRGSSVGGSQEDVNNKELQEAIRLSLIESRGGSGGKVGRKEDEEVQMLEKGGGRASRSGASKPTVTIDLAEDKENQLPPSGKSKALAPLPLDLRNLTTRPLSSSSSSSLSSPSASTTAPPPTAAVRAGELRSAYALQSVVRHLGRSANSGHYIADVRRAGSTPSSPALWTRYDDALVSALPQGDRVLEDDRSLQTGYIFIYRACA